MKPVAAACVIAVILLGACGVDQATESRNLEDGNASAEKSETEEDPVVDPIDLFGEAGAGGGGQGLCDEGGWIGARCGEETSTALGVRVTMGERLIYLDEPVDDCPDVYARTGSCIDSNFSLEATNGQEDRLRLVMDGGRTRYRLESGVLVEADGTVWTFSETGSDDYPLDEPRGEAVYENEFTFIADSDDGLTVPVQVEIAACNTVYACAF